MDNSTLKTSNKQLALVVKVGPAFSNDEIDRSHAALDQAGVPRDLKDHILPLNNRIAWLLGKMEAQRKYIALLEEVYVERSR